jgi:hypothetical protein
MADQFGALALPAPTSDTPLGDPGLKRLGDFLQAVINAYTATAWAAASPGPDTRLAVKTVNLFNPRENGFNENGLPGLFVWRSKGTSSVLAADDWLVDDVQIEAMWIMPLTAQEKQRERGAFMNAVVKTVGNALNLGRESVWADPTDPDPQAASKPADDDAFVLTHATSTSPTVLSGAGLDGALGGGVLAPHRGLTLTTIAASHPVFSASSPFVVDYKDALGRTASKNIQPTNDHGGETLPLGADVAQLVAIREPAQIANDGAFRVGATAWRGRGSALSYAGFAQCMLASWRFGHEKIDVVNSVQRPIEHAGVFALCMTISARETATEDPTNSIRYPYSGAPHLVASVHQPDADFVPSVDLT